MKNTLYRLFALSLLFISTNLLAQPPYTAGEAIEVWWSGTWYKGKVQEVKEDKYKVSYDGYASYWDEWVGADRLRRTAATNETKPTNTTAPASNTSATPATSNNPGAGQYKPGDRVELSYAGDWYRGTIKKWVKGSGTSTTYEAQMDGDKYTNHYISQYIRPLYRQNENQTFGAGNKVLFTRWDGKEYEGEVVGMDGGKYHISYIYNGTKSSEWVPEIRVKESPDNRNVVTPKFPGQKFNIGDRLRYSNGSFITGFNYGTVIAIDHEKRLYTIRDEKDASSRYSYPCYGVLGVEEKPDNSFFFGKWEVYVSGATSTFDKGDTRYRRFSGGMKLNPLEIKADGTYTWTTQDKKVIRGRWTGRKDLPGITILKGLDGLDWTVYQNTEAFAANASTRDEIRFHHLPTSTGYYMAYRIGANKSCVLAGRKF